MTTLAMVVSAVMLAFAAALRWGGASLVRTPRADALRDAAAGDERAQRVARLLDDRPNLQPALGLVHAALLVAAAIPVTWAATALASGWVLAVALIGIGVVIVVLGDSFPRSWGRASPRTAAYRTSRLLAGAIRFGLRASDLMEFEDDDDDDQEDDDDDDEDHVQEVELISSVLDFSETLVREVMVPRTDMVTVASDKDTDLALDVVIAEGRSRVPIIGESTDDIVGVLYARDLLGLMDAGTGPVNVTEIMRPAHFVPETKHVDDLLRELQANKVHLAIVVDEYGGTAGLVTIEDLIEEIVGEIVDEYDREEPMITPV
ncbi:CBS domain-containing protein, partial [bacterium]|nr:CBS domain-containing protein [bacterium]